DLSVGLPVKKRETSELKESTALTPKMVRTIPAARRAIPIPLLINLPLLRRMPGSFDSTNRFRLPWAKRRVRPIAHRQPLDLPTPSAHLGHGVGCSKWIGFAQGALRIVLPLPVHQKAISVSARRKGQFDFPHTVLTATQIQRQFPPVGEIRGQLHATRFGCVETKNCGLAFGLNAFDRHRQTNRSRHAARQKVHIQSPIRSDARCGHSHHWVQVLSNTISALTKLFGSPESRRVSFTAATTF